MSKNVPLLVCFDFGMSAFMDFVVANANGFFVGITLVIRVTEYLIKRKKKRNVKEQE